MKLLTSPLVIILVATLLGVGLSCYLVLKQVPEYAKMVAAMRPKPKVIPSHLPDRPPPVDVTSRAVSELKLAKDQLAVREAALLEQQKRVESGRLELERTRADIDLMRKQVEVYLAEAKGLSVKARAEVTVNELKNLKTLVQTYSTMSPKSTVAIMLQMDESSAVKILALMKVDVVAGIFEEMGKQAAGDPLGEERQVLGVEGRAFRRHEGLFLLGAARPETAAGRITGVDDRAAAAAVHETRVAGQFEATLLLVRVMAGEALVLEQRTDVVVVSQLLIFLRERSGGDQPGSQDEAAAGKPAERRRGGGHADGGDQWLK